MQSLAERMSHSTTAKKVYYYHGDKTTEGEYYCRRCDYFVGRDHFVSPHGKHNDFEVNQFRLKQNRKNGVPFGYYRPAIIDRTNLAE